MSSLPVRGEAVRSLGLDLPPGPMPAWRRGRPLKRWRYVGVYTSELMLCVGEVKIGPVPQRWWAVATPDGALRERTTFASGSVSLDGLRVEVDARGIRIRLELAESAGMEIVSPAGNTYIWTHKQACVPVSGTVEVDGSVHRLDGDHGFVDESAGYHERHTAWQWSAGVGMTDDGRRVGWNLVDGIHDDESVSERTVWIDGEPRAVGPVVFADDLSAVDGLRFEEWSAREHSTNALLIRSRYRQPFGTFTGKLPGDLHLAHGHGVMEDHDVRW